MPLIVIDLLSIHPLFYTNKQELVLGARYNVYKDRVIDLFSRIKSYGVRLVFFTDGPAREEKLPTCLKRRNNEYQRAMQALQVVYSGADLRSRLEDMDVASPVPFFGILRKMAKEFGDLNISVRNECDIELADYATKNGALAIISNDTDFLIFEGDWKFWSSGHLNVFRLKTLEFNRQALRETLGLRPDQMAILATMSGNDLVPYDSVRVSGHIYYYLCRCSGDSELFAICVHFKHRLQIIEIYWIIKSCYLYSIEAKQTNII